MIRINFFLFGLLLTLVQLNGQSEFQQFNDLLSKGDTAVQLKFLEKWESSKRNDPDLYVAYFNYYYKKSMKEIIRIEKSYPGKNKQAIQIVDTLTKEPEGYLYSDIYLIPEVIKKGLDYIDIGIKNFPSRLDMRFGKVYVLGQMNDYDSFTKEIINTIDYSDIIKNNWLWKDGQPLMDAKKFMLGTIQNYQNQIYNAGNDSLLKNMGSIAREVIKFYPDNIENLSNLAVVYLIQNNNKDALELLLRAEKINPQDCIVLNNIAQTYFRLGDKSNSIKYLNLVLKYGNADEKQSAKEKIDKIQKLQIN